MKNIINNIILKATLMMLIVGLLAGCDEHVLPEAGSIPDEIPPEAGFSFASQIADFRIIKFTNLSVEATKFQWDFGEDGKTVPDSVLNAQDPLYTYEAEGTYTVSLTATDALGVSSTITQEIQVEPGPFQPVIIEPGFEDNTLPDGSGDGRDSWRNSALGGVIQITGSPVISGKQGAKLTGSPSDQRIGYQELAVEKETNYEVSFIYTLKNDQTGFVIVDILDASGGTIESHEDAQNLVLGSVTVNDQDDPETYVSASVPFSSGDSEKIAIYFYNEGSVEARLDDFAIEIGREGAVPPSAAFDANQSEENFLEYTFANGSLNADTYLWDFGDGNTSTEESPTHVYDEANMYAVKLTATSAGGLSADFTSIIDIQAPVTAAFTFEADPDDFLTYSFMDASEDAVSLLWEFGDGFQFTGPNPVHTYDEEGTYTVRLTATSLTGSTSEASELIVVADPGGAIIPVILNGDFNDKQNDWKISTFTGGTRDPFNSTSDGSFTNYDGTDNGAKTPGAKWTMTTSAGEFKSSSSRYAYQAITVTPNTDYILEYEYAIKDDAATDPMGGRRIVGEILDGHFSDGVDAAASSEAGDALVTHLGTEANGKTSHTLVKAEFTSNSSGQVAIWIWAVTPVDAYVDNVKVYPK